MSEVPAHQNAAAPRAASSTGFQSACARIHPADPNDPNPQTPQTPSACRFDAIDVDPGPKGQRSRALGEPQARRRARAAVLSRRRAKTSEPESAARPTV